MNIDEFAGQFASARPQGGGYRVRCPAHEDRQASLMIHTGRSGNLLLKCHAGCETADVLAALGKTFADLRAEEAKVVTPMRRVKVAEYVYTDAHGEYLYTVVRTAPKGFYNKDLPDRDQRVLYRLPEIAAAKKRGATVYVVEGEKDADALASRGLVATCNVGGAGKFYPHYVRQLAGVAEVVVVADDDAAGVPHALEVARLVSEAGLTVRVLRPAAGCKDVADHFEAGWDLADLRPIDAPAVLWTVRAADIPPEVQDWAWTHYLPIGATVLFEGHPGTSKSIVTCDFAARFSTGAAMPDGSANGFGGAVPVLMVTAEDSDRKTIIPRLIAAGADLEYVHLIKGLVPDQPQLLDLSEHLEFLRNTIVATGARVVILDPLMALIGSKMDTAKDNSVRGVISPLALMVEELDVVLIVVRHLTKDSARGKANPVTAGAGSMGFVGQARAAFQFFSDREDPATKVFARAKHNLSSEANTPSIAYRLVEDEVLRARDARFQVPKVEWLGLFDATAEEMLNAAHTDEGGGSRKDWEAVLCGAVADGPKTWDTIRQILKNAGLSDTTAVRHRGKHLEIVYGEHGNRSAMWRKRSDSHSSTEPTLHVGAGPFEHPHTTPDLATSSLEHFAHGGGVPDVRDELPKCEVCGGPDGFYWPAPHFITTCQEHNPITGRPR